MFLQLYYKSPKTSKVVITRKVGYRGGLNNYRYYGSIFLV